MGGIGGGKRWIPRAPSPGRGMPACCLEVGVQPPTPGVCSPERSVPLLLPPWTTVTYLSAPYYFSLTECPFLTLQECECMLTRGDT